MSEYDVDFFVIGAGSGGVRAARIAALHGARVAIAEEWRIGGTCVIRGCVPKKLLVHASRFADAFDDAVGFGWTIGDAHFSWPDLIAAKDREIARLSSIYERNLHAAGVAIHAGRAAIEEPHVVRLGDGTRITAERVLVATGGRPVRPDFPGCGFTLTSNEMFDLPELPASLAIVGGGYIAVEFAALLQRLGCAVTLVHRGEKVLRGFDEDLREAAATVLEAAGVQLRLGTEIANLDRADGGFDVTFSTGASARFGQVMVASGRIPNIQDIGLEKVGVLLDHHGAIRVDAFSQTTASWIYAVGDVTNRLNLTPVAIREGHALADTLFGGKSTMVDHSNVPTAVFITPEIGTVGLTEEQVRARGAEIDIYKTTFRPLAAMLSGRQDRVLMKLVVDAATDRVLGVHIIGEHAAEMIQLAGVAVKLGATKADFDATVAVHPTSAEELVTLRVRWSPPVVTHEPGEIAEIERAAAAEAPMPDLVAADADHLSAEVVEVIEEASEPALQAAEMEATAEAEAAHAAHAPKSAGEHQT